MEELAAPSSWRASLAATAFICFLSGVAGAESPAELFKSANALYAEGRFSEAAQKYQAAADAGIRNWALEYNLGNAYYRSGQLGRAIVHYKKAFRLNTGQSDILYNLNLATTKAGDPVMPSSALPALGWRLFHSLPLNGLTILASLLFVLLCAAGGLGLYASWSSSPVGPGRWPSGMTPVLLLAFVFVSVWLGARIYRVEEPEGVVVAQVAEVRSGPTTSYPANFTIPEGRGVLILKEQEPIEGWIEIGIPAEGLKGWVPDTSVEVL